MPVKPNYRITPRTTAHLMRIEAAGQAVEDLPITSAVLAGLRDPRLLFSPTTPRLSREPARREENLLGDRAAAALPGPGAG